jgi:hypothetical protein
MPRSPQEQRYRAQRYGRRHRVLAAMHSRRALDVVVTGLVAELRASTVGADETRRLLAELRKHTDVKRRHAAIWAIVDALEAAQRLPDAEQAARAARSATPRAASAPLFGPPTVG